MHKYLSRLLFISFLLFSASSHAATPLITCTGSNKALQSTANPPVYSCATVSGGGGGTPGGTSGQVQYNNAGAFGGFTLGGDCTLNTGTGGITCTKSAGSAFAAAAFEALGGNIIDDGSGNLTISTGGVSTAMLANNAVTYAKMQSEGATTLLGNPTGAGHVPEEITLGTNLAFSGTTLNGPVVPANTSSTTSQWFSAYNSTTGAFTKSQPAFTDISGQNTLAQLPSIGANTALVNATAGSTTPTAVSLPSCTDTSGNHLNYTSATGFSCGTSDLHVGTVTSASVTTANGVSASVATATTTPAFTFTLGAITPTTVNSITLSGSSTPALAVTGTSSISGSNTGDQVVPVNTTATGSNFFTAYNSATGAFTKAQPAFSDISGQATNAQLATQTANTVLGALTATTPSGLALPSCTDSAGNHLNWTSGTGFSCGTSSSASGTVTTTGSPASGNLTKFSGTTSVTNGDLSGDCTTSSTLATTCTKTGGVSFGTAATVNTGTSGSTIPLLNGANTWSGVQTITNSDWALLGSSTGKTTFTSDNSGASNFTLHVPAANDTIADLAGSQAFTNKDLTGAGNTFPTFNQNTTGSAAKWTTARNLAGNSVDGSANVAFANKFIVQGTTDSGLSAAQFLGALSTGVLKNTTTTGVLSNAASADIIALFSTCSGAQYLGADGVCHDPAGGGTVTSIATTSPITGGTITTTGTIACATCATTTNGGALSGTAPIAISAAGVISGGGLGTVTGALKGNGSGTITQAACADLSDDGTACTASTGTSGATIPLLNAANTWSALQTNSTTGVAEYYSGPGAIETGVFSNGNSGTSKALNLDNGNKQSVTITGAVAMTLTTPTHPGSMTVVITMDGTGHVYSISGCKWPGATAITYSTAASKVDIISILYDGTNFYCMGGAAFS